MVVVLYLCAAAVVISGSQVLLGLAGPQGRIPPWEFARVIWRRPVPPVAAGLVALMAAMAVAQTVHPALVDVLQRDPDGGWWRSVTAVLVNSDGWFQLLFNFAALIAVAPVAARVLGNVGTLVVYLVAGLASHIVSTAGWSPHGAGNSVAICGLVGALTVGYALRGTRSGLRLLAVLVPIAAVILCLLTNNHGVGLAVGCLFGVLFAYLPAPAKRLATGLPQPGQHRPAEAGDVRA
jgi:rhomboid protease GluP